MRSDDPTGALLIGFFGGLWFFFKGFRVMREYKLLDDTPRMPIRSIPMGFVHLRGKAESSQLLSSPLTNTPCCFYKVDIEEWRSRGKSHEWVHICTDCNGYQFHLRDETGAVLIDAHSAEYDLQPTATRAVNSHSHSPQGEDTRLLEYVNSARAHSTFDQVSQWVDKRFEKASAADTSQLQEKRDAFRQLFSGMASVSQGGKVPMQAMQAMEKLMIAFGPSSDPVMEQHRQQMLANFKLGESMNQAGLLDQLIHQKPEAASGQFRLREYVVTPGQQYLISGTCMENPDSAASAEDRGMIAKGKNEPTFLISAESDIQLHHTLQKRALLMILGGAVAAILCAVFLLAHFKLL